MDAGASATHSRGALGARQLRKPTPRRHALPIRSSGLATSLHVLEAQYADGRALAGYSSENRLADLLTPLQRPLGFDAQELPCKRR